MVKKLILKNITQQYKADIAIQKCIDFISCKKKKNVSTMLWGSGTMVSHLIGEVMLSKLTRKYDII